MNRVLPLETKVNIMEESLRLCGVEEAASKYGVSEEVIYYWFNHKIKPAFGEILKNDPPGPKRSFETETELAAKGEHKIEKRPATCEKCGATHIWKMAHMK